MAGGKALVYGPVNDWGKGGIKVLLKNGEESRQYALEVVTDWSKVERFRALNGEEKLQAAMEKAKGLAESLAGEDEGFAIVYSREERVLRAGREVLMVKDGMTAERAIEILSSGLVIQDVTESNEIPEMAISSSTTVEKDIEVEEVVVRTEYGVKSWTIKTSRAVRIAERGRVEFVLSKIEEGDEVYESDNEVTRARSTKKGKRKAVGECLSQMVEELGYSSSFIRDPSVGLVARSLFPSGRVIPDSQGSAEERGDDGEDSDIDLEDLVEAEYGMLRTLPTEGLSKSRHAAKGLSKEEADSIVKNILGKAGQACAEEEAHGRRDDEDEDMGGGDENGDEATSGSYDLPSDRRVMWELVGDLVANLKTIEEIERIKGGRPFRVRRSLAAAKSAVNTAGLMLDQGGTSDTTGGNLWEDLEDEAMESRDMEKVTLVRKVAEGGISSLESLGKKVDKLSEMVATLAALNGVGTPDECEKARKLQVRRQAQVIEARRAAPEVKKISVKEKEERELKKGMEEAKLAV